MHEAGRCFVFFGRRREALKVLFADRTGMCVFYKRLDRGRFVLPVAQQGSAQVRIDERVLADLLDGLDVEETRVRRARPTRH